MVVRINRPHPLTGTVGFNANQASLFVEVKMSARFIDRMNAADRLSWKFRDLVEQDAIDAVNQELNAMMNVELRDRYFAAKRGMTERDYMFLKQRIPMLDASEPGPARGGPPFLGKVS